MKVLKAGVFSVIWKGQNCIMVSKGDGTYIINHTNQTVKRSEFTIIREL